MPTKEQILHDLLNETREDLRDLRDNHFAHLSAEVAALTALVGQMDKDLRSIRLWILSGFTLTISALLGAARFGGL